MKDSTKRGNGREKGVGRQKERKISAFSTKLLIIFLNFIVRVTKQGKELGVCVPLQMETKQNTRIPLMIFKNMFTTKIIYSPIGDSVPEFVYSLP